MGRGRGAGRSLYEGIRVSLIRNPRGDGTLHITTKAREDGWDAYREHIALHIPDLLEVRSTADALRVLGRTALEQADVLDPPPTSPA